MRRVGLLTRYFRLWRKSRCEIRRLRLLLSEKDEAIRTSRAETHKQKQYADTLQTKIEIIQRTSTDRIFEAIKLLGTGQQYAGVDSQLRDIRSDITETSFSPNESTDATDDLLERKKSLHWEMGRAGGLTDQEIKANWEKHRPDILASLEIN